MSLTRHQRNPWVETGTRATASWYDSVMSAALITGTSLATVGLIVTFVLGFTAESSAEVLQHTTVSVFFTLVTLLAHSMTMFYLIGKGRAIREAVADGGLSRQFVVDISRVRRPVFSMGTLAMAATMATAIIGGGVDTRVIPVGVHTALAVLSVLTNVVAVRAEVVAVLSSSRIVAEVNRLLGAVG